MVLRIVVAALAIVACAGKKTATFELTSMPQNIKAESPLCSPCIQLGEQSLQILINAILNVGVMGGCGKLCGNLPAGKQQTACNLICDAVGIKEFIKALNNTDLDPFYLCEELHACPAGPDDAHIELMSLDLSPTTMKRNDLDPDFQGQGVDLTGTLSVNVSKASGPGEWSVEITGPVDGLDGPLGDSFLLPDGLKEGVQQLGVKVHIVDTDPDPSDPTKFPVTWMPGTYEFRAHMCQGECGSKHPHSKDFGKKVSNFTVTETSGTIAI